MLRSISDTKLQRFPQFLTSTIDLGVSRENTLCKFQECLAIHGVILAISAATLNIPTTNIERPPAVHASIHDRATIVGHINDATGQGIFCRVTDLRNSS